MRFNDTAAAYGLFQVVFADVANHLAIATFRLRALREPSLSFNTVFGQQFTKTFGQFKDELRSFDGRSVFSDSLREVREACSIISGLAEWRNDYIHARVQMSERGYALYNWRSGKRLELNREQIETKMDLAVKAIVTLEVHVQQFVHQLKWDEEFEALFSTLPELSEPQTMSDPQ
jgi:hypothetical protein